MNKSCVLCHKPIPNKTLSKLIECGYSKVDLIIPGGWNNTKCEWRKPISNRTAYFCMNHTPKEKVDAIWLIMQHKDPYKRSRFDNLIQ